MLDFIKNIFIRLLTGQVNVSDHTKCVSLTNRKFTTQPTIITLHPNEYTQGLRYSLFAVNLGKCVGSRNTLYELSNEVCVQKKARFKSMCVQLDYRNE